MFTTTSNMDQRVEEKPQCGQSYSVKKWKRWSTPEDGFGLVALGDIPVGTCTEPMEVTGIFEKEPAATINVYKSSEGKLCISGSHQDVFWIQYVSLAEDCHSCNAIIQEVPQSNKVLLYVVRTINSGELIKMWFSEKILGSMMVPFLSPNNIQGENCYVCHICGRQFEVPNPLKIHLALDCDSHNLHTLWRKLERQLSDEKATLLSERNNFNCLSESVSDSEPTNYSNKLRNKQKDFREIPIKSSVKEEKLSEISSSMWTETKDFSEPNNSSSEISIIFSSQKSKSKSDKLMMAEIVSSRYSAFQPYLKVDSPSVSSNGLGLRRCQSEGDNTRVPSFNVLNSSWPSLLPPVPLILVSKTLSNYKQVPERSPVTSRHSYNQQAAVMETFVSNLGRSTQGHLCIYCGKVYSRKYGLKIHIRTHTGYKPLKCKYCLRPFGDPSNLNKHVRLHAEGETPYKCEQCGKVLVRRRDLERHIKSRHSPPPGLSDPNLSSSSATQTSGLYSTLTHR